MAALGLLYERQGLFADALASLARARDIMAAQVAMGSSQLTSGLAWFEQQIARLQGQAKAP